MSSPTPPSSSSDTILATPGQPESSILFTASGTIQINAPASHVWSTITDFSSYSAWNSNTPSIAPATDSPSPTQISPGSTLTMTTIMTSQNNKEYTIPIEILNYDTPTPNTDTDSYKLAWRGKLMPTWFAVSERVQEIRPLPTKPDGVERCEVLNYESMSGWGAYVFKYVMGIPEQMRMFNLQYLEDLKTRAERTWKEG